jgi:hypothetical protein
MKVKHAIFNGDIITVEVIVIGGRTNIKVADPKAERIPSEEFDKTLLFNSKSEAEKYLKKDEEPLGTTVTEH